MKYYICENNNGIIEVVKEISLVEYNKWKKSTEQLTYYSMAKIYKDIAIKNGLEIEKYLKELGNVNNLDMTDATLIGTEANRLMLNYLVSFRTFVDNLQSYSAHLVRGCEFKENILRRIYDKEDVYAFFYKLRNFATHFSMVFDSITIGHEKIEVQCSKKHLLEYKKWKANNIDFINNHLEEYLPMLEYIQNNNMFIMSIYLGYLQYYGEDIQKMHNKVMDLMVEYKNISPLFMECESKSSIEIGNVFGIGLDILKEATDELENLLNVKINYIGPKELLKNE